MQKIAVFIFGLAIVVAGFARTPIVHASGMGTIMLSSSSVAVATGDEFTVSVWVDPMGESIDTVRVNLNYSPSILEGVEFDLSSQFPSLSPGYSINNVTGDMTFGGFRFGDRVTSSGLFATATFKALSAGTATISVGSDSKLINDGDEKVSATGFGSVMVSTSGDAVSGTTTVATTGSLEEQALVYFGAFAGRMPSNGVDWEALHCMAYDTCYPTDVADRRIDREATSLEVFGAKYAHIPSSSMDWKALHAIAYTEIFYDWSAIDAAASGADEAAATATAEAEAEAAAATEAAAAAAAAAEAEAEAEAAAAAATAAAEADASAAAAAAAAADEGTTADEAIGLFGAITGRLPSTSADWVAIDYMQNGYTPATKDDTKEAQALSLYGSVFGRMPSTSSDWNVIAAIAYSGAIL